MSGWMSEGGIMLIASQSSDVSWCNASDSIETNDMQLATVKFMLT